jgi:glutamate synthase domain-containing protein 1
MRPYNCKKRSKSLAEPQILLGSYYPDLHEPDFESALALVHQRFSTTPSRPGR